MAELRPHYIDVDLKKNTQYNVPVVTQNDTATHFIVRVTDDGLSDPELLDAYQEITMTSQRPDGESFYLTGTRIPGTNEIEFHLGTDETAFSGSVLASLQFYLVEDASRYTSAQFRYDVKKDLTKNYTPTQREETLVEVVLRDGPVAIQEAKDAKFAVDGALVELEQDKTAAIDRLDEVTEENKTIFRQPVATFAALSTTYPNPEHGTTVRVTSEAASYRFSDGTWVKTDEYNPTAIDQVTAQLADKASQAEVNAMLGNLADATPNFANDVSGMSDTTKLYVNLSDGFLYSHNGTSWNSTEVQYQSTGIGEDSVTLENISNASLLLDYVKGQSQSSLPVKKGGSYEVELSERGNLYLSNGNIIDLLNFSDGTQTLNGVTVTVTGNHVSVVGTATANTFVRLSDGLSVQPSNAGLNSKAYSVPNIPNYSLALANRTYNADIPGMTVNFRSTVTGNFISKIVTDTSPHTLVPYSNEWASLYMFLPVGNYQVEFDIALMPFEYKVEHEVAPSTKILNNVKKSRVEVASGYIFSDKSGTATNLVNVYENLQSGGASSNSNEIYVESHTDYFYFYIKGSNEDSNKYLRFTFEHYVNVHSKADGWVLGLVDAVEKVVEEFVHLYPVVVAGEWEMAVRIADRPDFIGCKQHGSEINFYEKFYVDGTEWIPDNSSFWCNEIKVVQKSNMYDPLDDPTPLDQAVPVGEHMRVHTITKESIHLDQRIKWLGDFTMDMSYITMLPIARGNNAETSYQITEKAYNNDTYEEIDVSDSGHSGNVRVTDPSMWHLYSNSTGISAETHSIIKNKPASSKSFVQNTADRYNKVYFAYCDVGYAVENGDVWQNESIYKLNITSE